MAVQQFIIVIFAVVLGAGFTEVADDWGHRSGWAQLWFFGLAPAVLDVVHSSMAWVAATAVYAIQVLAVYGILQALVLAFITSHGVGPERHSQVASN